MGNNGCSDGTQVACAGFNKDLTRCPIDPDVTGDGLVSIGDSISIQSIYNEESGDVNYFAVADVNCDFKISVIDIARTGFQLGTR